jgi:anthranilate phosphoribosyltransferase
MLAIQDSIKRLTAKEDLDYLTARNAAMEIMEGKASPVLIGSFLVGLHVKGETTEEIKAIAEAMMEKAVQMDLGEKSLLDTCGTGGDSSRTLNISTAAAFVCAACGVPVAKHGNRSVSSVSGSADVLEALGAKVDLTPDEARRVFEKAGITFLFAPIYHPGMKHAAPVRRELGARTVFNFIGPMVNPASARFRLLGVSSRAYVKKLAEVLKGFPISRAIVFHAEDGLDEFSLNADNFVIEISEGRIREYTINHADMGLKKTPVSDVKVSSPEESAEAILRVFRGEKIPHREYVVANSAAALYAASFSRTLRGAVEAAKDAIDSGKALRKLEEFVSATGGRLVVS